MAHITSLPLRQKILVGLSIIGGLLLMICTVFNLVGHHTLNTLILFYGMGIPLFLLMSDTIIDLNDRSIFMMWLIIAVVIFGVSLLFNEDKRFLVRRFRNNSSLDNLVAAYSTSSLKALLIFLLAYWPINKLFRNRGLFIVNTFRQSRWYHDIAHRKISWLDVLANLVLVAVIILSGVLGR
jgi:hypothetical protein